MKRVPALRRYYSGVLHISCLGEALLGLWTRRGLILLFWGVKEGLDVSTKIGGRWCSLKKVVLLIYVLRRNGIQVEERDKGTKSVFLSFSFSCFFSILLLIIVHVSDKNERIAIRILHTLVRGITTFLSGVSSGMCAGMPACMQTSEHLRKFLFGSFEKNSKLPKTLFLQTIEKRYIEDPSTPLAFV